MIRKGALMGDSSEMKVGWVVYMYICIYVILIVRI